MVSRNQHCSYSAEFPTVPVAPTTPKEKRRWSFRRSAMTSRDFSSMDLIATTLQSVVQSMLETENDRRLSSVSIFGASVVSCNDAVMAVGQPAPAVTQLGSVSRRRTSAIQEAASIRIQAFFRGQGKRLCALKGLVKLQALVRSYLIDRHIEDNVKVVEMDFGQSRGSTKSRNGYLTNNHVEKADQRYSPHHYAKLKQNCLWHMLLAKMSPNACSEYRTEQLLSQLKHIAVECSTKSLCWNCREPGHMGSDFQNEVICHTFGKTGHIARDFAAPSLPPGDLRVCNNCYKTGHIVMVDLLDRAGHLEEALNLAAMMPIEACVEHSLVLIGSIEILIREKGVRKNPGCSLMEAEDGIIHELFAGDITHPKSKEIKEALDDLLQTSFGLFTTTAGIPIRIVKNLRVCEDFHTAMCGASLIMRREIVEG
ncbi:hypothetical protein IFM89_025821 [Coptis chinensis]|uniref:Uncharacterized protein n=1 Tax=Coptis chinensis TaxID=261450 RepID=A0A835LIN3_9MAGN|nr:hypothetical protein IFM89_025821 [Coptis chinensis]